MRRILLPVIGAALIVSASAASLAARPIPATAPIQATANGKWNVDYGDWNCVLRRDLISAGKPAAFSLTLEPLSSVAWMRIGLAGGGRRSDGDDAVMFIDGQRLPGTIHYNAFPSGQYRVREFMLNTKQQDLSAIHDRVRFWAGKDGDVEARLDNFQSAWTALNQCMADFNKDLGITPADVAQVAKPPEGDAFSFVEFPSDPDTLDMALFFWVSADGKIENCRLLKPSGIKPFDDSICKELEAKGRFKPAQNASGAPVRAPYFEHDVLRKETMTTAVGN